MAALGVEVVRLALREPLAAAWGSIAARELVRVRLLFSDSDWGIGEAAPLEPYDGVPLGAVLAALDAYGAVLEDADPEDSAESLLAACRAERPLPQALAAIDLALWDRAGRRAGRSVAVLLSPAAAGAVAVNALVGAEDRSGAARAAGAAVAAGFGCVKVKVGVGDDAGRLAAVRSVIGPEVAIRADANGAWRSPPEALANLRALAPVGLELCEEPVHGVEALRAVRAESPVPVAMDETAAEPGAASSGRRRRGLPQDRPLRRDLRAAARGRRRPRGRQRGLRGLVARRPARDRRGHPRRRRARRRRPGRPLRPRHPRWVRGPRPRPARPDRGRDPRAGRPRPAALSASGAVRGGSARVRSVLNGGHRGGGIGRPGPRASTLSGSGGQTRRSAWRAIVST